MCSARATFRGDRTRGVAGFTRIRVREAGAILAIDEANLRNIVQVDSELSEIMMRAFILRRMGLVASGQSEVMLLGSRHSADTLRLREFLSRNAHPYVNIDVDDDADVQTLLDRFHIAVDEIPVVIGSCGRVFKNPTIADIARYLGMSPAIDVAAVHDLVVVGAGPAGLAAAVYAASEGLDVLVWSRRTLSAGRPDRVRRSRTIWGLPVRHPRRAGRAFMQAQNCANINVAIEAQRLRCGRRPYSIECPTGARLARHRGIATGAKYREPELENLRRFIGAGSTTPPPTWKQKLCQGEDIGRRRRRQLGGAGSGVSGRNLPPCARAGARGGPAGQCRAYLVRRIRRVEITLHTRTQSSSRRRGNGSLERSGATRRTATWKRKRLLTCFS
jgi:thioredoxin reductase (NADPH)